MDIITYILVIMYIVALGCTIYCVNKPQTNKLKKGSKSINKVHFYVARDKIGDLYLYMGKPIKDRISYKAKFDCVIYLNRFNIENYGLNKNDYANLKFEDEPVEVFLNLED